jgi:hypothetical protein
MEISLEWRSHMYCTLESTEYLGAVPKCDDDVTLFLDELRHDHHGHHEGEGEVGAINTGEPRHYGHAAGLEVKRQCRMKAGTRPPTSAATTTGLGLGASSLCEVVVVGVVVEEHHLEPLFERRPDTSTRAMTNHREGGCCVHDLWEGGGAEGESRRCRQSENERWTVVVAWHAVGGLYYRRTLVGIVEGSEARVG